MTVSKIDLAIQTQLKNIERRSGKSLDELAGIVRRSGLTKHGEIRDMLKRELGLGHGDANTLVHFVLKSDGQAAAEGKGETEVLDEIYAGKKADLRPIHDALMARIVELGEFTRAPKKGYVSLRRNKQFAMIGPKTNDRVEVGLNVKSLPPDARLLEEPKGKMCNYIVRVTEVNQVDDELLGWIGKAYESAG
jgi:hypothetical protein